MQVNDAVAGLKSTSQAAPKPAPIVPSRDMETLHDAVRDLITTYHDLNPPRITTLHADPSPLEFLRHVSTNRPFVLRGGARDWKARSRWSAAYLCDVMAGQRVNVSVTPRGNADSVVPLNSGGSVFVKPHERIEEFSGVLRAIQRQEQEQDEEKSKRRGGWIRYAQTQNDNLRGEYETLFSDVPRHVPFAKIALGREPEAVNFWLGSSRSTTALHKDNYENVYVQILGKKHFVLLPPVEAPCVGEKAVLAGTYEPVDEQDPKEEGELRIRIDDPEEYVPFATWDPDEPGVNATPYSKFSRALRVTLDEGDMLYLPALWYHKVSQSCDDEGLCCAVNYWYDMEFSGGFWAMANHVRSVGLLSMRDPTTS